MKINWGHQPSKTSDPGYAPPSTTSGVPIGTAATGQHCPWCSTVERIIYHAGVCPRIKSIEYYSDGQIKRIELHEVDPWQK